MNGRGCVARSRARGSSSSARRRRWRRREVSSDRARDALLVAREDGEADPDIPQPLTPREVEILALLAEGLPNKAIASRLGISDQTVKFHVSAIYGKLGASNRTDAVGRGVRRGLIVL